MPRQRSTKHIPRAAAQLAVIFHTLQLPIHVLKQPPGAQRIFDAVMGSLKETRYNCLATFNRKFAAVKRTRPESFDELKVWLSDPSVRQMLIGPQ